MCRFAKSISIMLLLMLLAFLSTGATDIKASETEAADLTLAPKEGAEGEWELRGPDDKLMAVIKSKEKKSFKIYKANGSYMGHVYESFNWVPRNARQKRELQIPIEDVKLFLGILQAEGTYEPNIGDFKLKPDENAEVKWELLDPDETVVGTVEKSERGYKFHDGDKFMGYINTSGIWAPKLGINRREMRITPDQATFCLNVYYAITSK